MLPCNVYLHLEKWGYLVDIDKILHYLIELFAIGL